ncbi:MAG: type II toxin-antitoxin system prevent-host-death family antitoxin [Candidatus Entotheonellia bacterium]
MAVKIISMSELRQQLKDILATLEATGEPYCITQYSRPKAVLVRYADYNALTEPATTEHPHIVRRPEISGGEPLIRGTRITVRHIVERVQAGQTVETILAALPHLTRAQVHAALAYYYDHQAEIDRLLEQSRPDRVLEGQGLQVKRVAKGVAVVHDAAGRW